MRIIVVLQLNVLYMRRSDACAVVAWPMDVRPTCAAGADPTLRVSCCSWCTLHHGIAQRHSPASRGLVGALNVRVEKQLYALYRSLENSTLLCIISAVKLLLKIGKIVFVATVRFLNEPNSFS